MKKTVFISSTYEDLSRHRAKLWDCLEKYDVSIRGMEQFGARKAAPLETCLTEVEQSDIYVGVIALRLGSIDESTGKSFTQLEYEKAYELDKDIMIYLFDEKNGRLSPQFIDFGENHQKLLAFKSVLKERHTIDTFVDEADLAEKLNRRFDELLFKKPDSDEPLDEYVNSARTIKKLLLLPKVFSGKEIKLKIKLEGQPFAASKAICSLFNLEYGKTIGAGVKIIEPNLSEIVFEHIFAGYNLADDFLSIDHEKEIEVYVKILFTEDAIDNVKANFINRSTNAFSISLMESMSIFGKRTIIPAEGKLILVITNIVKKDSN